MKASDFERVRFLMGKRDDLVLIQQATEVRIEVGSQKISRGFKNAWEGTTDVYRQGEMDFVGDVNAGAKRFIEAIDAELEVLGVEHDAS